ncbi:MAG: TRAP transporter substrate-binding protein DctP [Acidobacteria bacterium]|nr:TRAP transporter substrate-binding protein DctP [Acidobacteriota bacterium]
MFTICRNVLTAALLAGLLSPLAAQRGGGGVRVNLGTVVPKDSAWYEVLVRMKQDWATISSGRVDLRIYPGGSLGDDVEMLRKVRIGQLQAVAVTSVGLSRIDDSIEALHTPMLFGSYEELDYVREKMAPKLEAALNQKGFVVLNWSDGGWAQFFTKKPAKTLDDIRGMKLWIGTGDPKAEQLYRDFDMRPTPLPMTEMLTALQTGLIEAIDVPPLFAMLDGSFQRAPFMTDIRWAPVMGGTVISKEAWERIPADLRPKLLASAKKAGEEMRGRIRQLGEDSIAQMKQRGLTVVSADREAWQREVEAAYPKMRGKLAPAALFDEAIRLRDEYRAKR